MISFLMLGSLVLGLIAWILPGINLNQQAKAGNKNWVILSIISISACAISIFFQLFYHYHLVDIGDGAALMDTTGTSIVLSTALLIGTLILNVITLIVYRDKTAR